MMTNERQVNPSPLPKIQNVFDPQKLFLNNQKSPSVKSMDFKFQNMNVNVN